MVSIAELSLKVFDSGQATGEGSTQPQLVVFIHGIRSKPEVFAALEEKLERKLKENGIEPSVFQFVYFGYKYREKIAKSGEELTAQLKRYCNIPNLKVTIVGHSMGGLVGRLALLQHGDKMPFVKRLVMLATPNHGTLHTGQMGILSQLIREISGTMWALTTTKTGVLELTQISKLLDTYLNQTAEERTRHVEYISVPATCFHEDAGLRELVILESSRKIALVPLSMELLKAHPCWTVQLKRPHDGIVEESSVFLGTRDIVTRRSERTLTCEGEPDCGPYAHLVHPDFPRESHVTIQAADRTASILADLLASATFADFLLKCKSTYGFAVHPKKQPQQNRERVPVTPRSI